VLKATSLSQQLSVTNADDRPFSFTTLLHTYFSVSHISKVSIRGLQGLSYIDKVIKDTPTLAENRELVKFDGETDRIYLSSGARELEISDGGNCDLVLKTTGFDDAVVWNPAVEKARAMADLGESNWHKFVCVEAGSVAKPIQLEPGKKWEGAQGISLKFNGTAASASAGAGKL